MGGGGGIEWLWVQTSPQDRHPLNQHVPPPPPTPPPASVLTAPSGVPKPHSECEMARL